MSFKERLEELMLAEAQGMAAFNYGFALIGARLALELVASDMDMTCIIRPTKAEADAVARAYIKLAEVLRERAQEIGQ